MSVLRRPLLPPVKSPVRPAIGFGDETLPRLGLLYFARSPLYEDWEPVDFESYTMAEDFVWLGHKLPESLFSVLGEGFWFEADGTPITHVPTEIEDDTTSGVYFNQKKGLGVYDLGSISAAYILKIEAYYA